MLRALLVAIVLANVLFLAWTQGWLDGLMAPPQRGAREPDRLQTQHRPEVVKVLPSGFAPQPAAASASAASAVGSSASSALAPPAASAATADTR